MNLRELAEQDLGRIQEDSASGFGWSITVTDPNGTQAGVTGFSNDIHEMIDPETGAAVSGQSASVSIRIAHLVDQGLGVPRGIADDASRPWIVECNDLSGSAYRFKVKRSHPDRGIGNVTCILETYE